MTTEQSNRMAKAFGDFSAASAAKSKAEQDDAAAGAAMEKAKEYARVGVLVEMQKLQDAANADAVAAVGNFNVAFQAACDATNALGLALKELQDATNDSLNTPGTVEKVV